MLSGKIKPKYQVLGQLTFPRKAQFGCQTPFHSGDSLFLFQIVASFYHTWMPTQLPSPLSPSNLLFPPRLFWYISPFDFELSGDGFHFRLILDSPHSLPVLNEGLCFGCSWIWCEMQPKGILNWDLNSYTQATKQGPVTNLCGTRWNSDDNLFSHMFSLLYTFMLRGIVHLLMGLNSCLPRL